MKTRVGIFLFLLVFTLQGCEDTCSVESKYFYYEPVFSTSAQIKAAVGLIPPTSIKEAGKIYFYEGNLFINEVGSGIHIIDNHDPSSPKPLSFLTIPGNYDLAIQNNLLYADSYIDLVVFDISNLSDIKEVSRIEGLFNAYNSLGFFSDTEKGVVTDWAKKEQVTLYTGSCAMPMQSWGGVYYNSGVAFAEDVRFSSKAALSPSGITSNTQGVGGSMARFTIAENYLYAMDGGNIDIVSLEDPTDPESKKEINIGWDIETLFPYEKKLFIGSRSGMYILDIKDPETPVVLSLYQHLQSCDPVVVEGDYAYVTLRSGNSCQGFTNQLEVIDIKNPESPTLLTFYPMTNPHGLGIDNGVLFICDGEAGLKIYDALDVNAIDENQLAIYDNIQALDVIPFNKVAMVIGKDGLTQYDYADVKNIKLLSTIPIQF
ncbi:MAG: hypothetical protein AABY93_03040 [Bacteroidota bacterium]